MKFSPMCPYVIITSNLLQQPHFLRKQNFIYLNKKKELNASKKFGSSEATEITGKCRVMELEVEKEKKKET